MLAFNSFLMDAAGVFRVRSLNRWNRQLTALCARREPTCWHRSSTRQSERKRGWDFPPKNAARQPRDVTSACASLDAPTLVRIHRRKRL